MKKMNFCICEVLEILIEEGKILIFFLGIAGYNRIDIFISCLSYSLLEADHPGKELTSQLAEGYQ